MSQALLADKPKRRAAGWRRHFARLKRVKFADWPRLQITAGTRDALVTITDWRIGAIDT